MKYQILLVSFLFVLSACCTKKACFNAFDLREIHLKGYTSAEMNDVTLTAYEKGSDFSTLIESETLLGMDSQISESDHLLVPGITFSGNYDYRIELAEPYQVLDITNIVTTTDECNDCFLSKDEYIVMESYELNGELIEERYFFIQK